MKKRLQGMIAGILIGVMFSGIAVYAATGSKTIEAYYNNIKVYKDNVLCELKDANGTTIEPFIYNGTTYMPVRGTANLAGMEVEWDGKTQSVYLWDELVPDGTYLMDVCPPYATSSEYEGYSSQSGKSFMMAGEKFSNGFTIGENHWNMSDCFALFNLNSKFSVINLSIGLVDDNQMYDTTVCFYVDGKLVKEIDIEADGLPKTVSIPVNYGLQLKILVPETNYTVIGFGNITVE
ncbi:MAG: hypothetical protein IJ002_00700 [Clostridia bacterium]|nr:hypothetical protein [Clostridia bacterium]